MREFVESKDYLGGLEITFQGKSSKIYHLSNEEQLEAISGLLKQIENDVRKNIVNS